MKISEMEVSLVDHMGSDLNVVNAARVSFAKQSDWEYEFDELLGTLSDNPQLSKGDTKLINYLARHNHWTPFGHTSVSLRLKTPIFVARQFVKHQVGLVWNEVSRRYVDDEPEFWFPAEYRARPDGSIKQGSGSPLNISGLNYDPHAQLAQSLAMYMDMIDYGMAPEQARMFLPLNTMTEWIWTGSLAAWSRVCKLRLDPHAQLEIQEPTRLIAALVEPLYPVSFKALMEN